MSMDSYFSIRLTTIVFLPLHRHVEHEQTRLYRFRSLCKNYMKWVQDVKLYLTTKSPIATIEEAMDELVGKANKANDMIFI